MNQLAEIRTVIALIHIVVTHVGGNLTLNQLLILAAVWEADMDGKSLAVSDIANLCHVPRSTASSIVARLSDVTANGMGLIAFDDDPVDRRRKFVRPSRQLKTLARSMVSECTAYRQRKE